MSESRSASLRVAHQRDCPMKQRTALSSMRGCTCTPSYYTSFRAADGRTVKGTRMKDRRTADRSLRKLQVAIDEGRAGLTRTEKISFREWAERFETILEQSGRRGSTIRAYAATIGYAKDTFGGLPLSGIGNDELRRFVAAIRSTRTEREGRPARGGGDAVVSKHLRHLSAMLAQAVEDRLLDSNPVPRFRRGLKLTIPRGTPAFSDLELARLLARLEALDTPPVYTMFVRRPLALAPARTLEVAPPAVGFLVFRLIADQAPRCRSGAEP